MKSNLKLLIPIVLTIIIFSCKPKNEVKNTNENNAEEVQQKDTTVYPVKIMNIGIGEIDKVEQYSATINAWEEAHIGPAMSNQIEKIFVEPGDRVKKGNLLVKMDQSTLIQTKIQYEDTKRDLERMDTLIAYGSISKQVYDKTKMGYELAKSALQTLDENVNLYAPFDGIITGKYYNEGEMYSSMAPNMQTGVASLISIMQINVLKVIVSVSESYWPIVTKGMKASLTCDIYPGEKFNGFVYNVYPTINPSTKTFDVEIKIPNSNEKLRPGMYAKVELNFGEREILVVPVSSVLKQEGTNNRYVFIEKNNIAEQRFVKPGRRFDDKMEIVSGLNVGENLIIAGQAKLMDKCIVKIVND